MTEPTPSLPASGHGEVAGLVEELRRLPVISGSWVAQAVSRAADALEAQARELAEENERTDRWQNRWQEENDRALAAEAHLAALESTPSPVEARADGVRVKVRKLKWDRKSTPGQHRARTEIGAYNAYADGTLTYNCADLAVSTGLSWSETEAAAQADYESRILGALESTPAQPVREGQEGKAEPVGWTSPAQLEALAKGQPAYVHRDGNDEFLTVALYASQPDPAAEIAEAVEQANHAVLSMLWMPGVRAALDGLPEDDPVQPYVKMHDETIARAERAESELAVIREALSDAVTNLEMYRGAGIDDVIAALEAALANTAHRGQEEKGNG